MEKKKLARKEGVWALPEEGGFVGRWGGQEPAWLGP